MLICGAHSNIVKQECEGGDHTPIGRRGVVISMFESTGKLACGETDDRNLQIYKSNIYSSTLGDMERATVARDIYGSMYMYVLSGFQR